MPEIEALIAQVADDMLAEEAELAEMLDRRIFEAAPMLAADGTIAAQTSASTRANLRRWLTAIRVNPERQIGGEPPPEAIELALTLTRRGMDTGALLTSYRTGQNAVWGRWMELAAERIPDRGQLISVLERGSAAMAAYVDRVLFELLEQIQREREAMLAAEPTRRAETIRVILDGDSPLGPRASARLGWELGRLHTAMILWSQSGELEPAALERAATALSEAAGCGRPLTVPVGAATLWGWMSGCEPDRAAMEEVIGGADPELRVAIGPAREGIDGFRRTHAAALDTQRIAADSIPLGGSAVMVDWEETQVAALAGRDRRAVNEFIEAVLGPLAGAGEATATLRETARIYLEEGSNAPRAAARLHLHRNTVLYRVGRAEELLGHPLGRKRLALMLALELARRMPEGTKKGAPEDALSRS